MPMLALQIPPTCSQRYSGALFRQWWFSLFVNDCVLSPLILYCRNSVKK
jgi:hypothetical protein